MYELSKLVSGYDIIKFTILKSLGVKNSLNKCNIKKKKYKNLIIKFLTEYDFLDRKNLYLRKKSFYNLKGFVDLIIYTNKKKKLRNSGGRIGGLFITGKTIKKCKKNLKNMIDKFNLYEDKKFT